MTINNSSFLVIANTNEFLPQSLLASGSLPRKKLAGMCAVYCQSEEATGCKWVNYFWYTAVHGSQGVLMEETPGV